jgi:transposase-like protein
MASAFQQRSSGVRCWYHRFSLSLRDIEELLLERGVAVPYGQQPGGE